MVGVGLMGAPSGSYFNGIAANMTGHDIMTGLYKALRVRRDRDVGLLLQGISCRADGDRGQPRDHRSGRAFERSDSGFRLFSYVYTFVRAPDLRPTMSEPEINRRDGNTARDTAGAGNAIEVRDLRRRFGRQQVLDGVTLDFPAGQITTIVGPSGSRQDRPAEASESAAAARLGQIMIDGVEVTRLGATRAGRRARKIRNAVPGRRAVRLDVGIRQCRLPAGREDRAERATEIAERVRETLKAVGLEGMEDKFPSEIERRDAEAGGAGPRTGAPPEDSHARRADHRPRSHAHRQRFTQLIRRTQENFHLTVVMVSHDVPAGLRGFGPRRVSP